MPQLNKGGKFVFGLSVIHPDLTIHIPPQTLLEYDATRDGKVIIFTGSKITGGFCVRNCRKINCAFCADFFRVFPKKAYTCRIRYKEAAA